MVSLINEREVFDLETGMFVPQHTMLKILMERAGLSRKELHLATKGKLNTNRTASWLSDIFRGDNRHLSMRDIVPVIKAFKLNKKDEGHYIAEFFKAHCDGRLHPFIKTSQQSLKVQTLDRRNAELQNHINSLMSAMFYERHVTQPIKNKILKQQVLELTDELAKFKAQSRPPEPQRKDFDSDEEHFFAWDTWQSRHGTFEPDFDNIDAFEPDFDDIDEYLDNLSEKSLEESQHVYHDARNNWVEAIKEMDEIQRQDSTLFDYVKAFMPANFDQIIIEFLNHTNEFPHYVLEPMEAWLWLSKRFNPRPENYVLVSLLQLWKKENVSSFYLTDERYEAYFATDSSNLDRMKQLHTTNGRDSFRSFLTRSSDLMRRKYPALYSLLQPIKSVQIINHSSEEKMAFQLYQQHAKSGLDSYVDFFDFYESHFPSALFKSPDFDFFYTQAACHTPLDVGKPRQWTLGEVYDFFGDAQIRYQNVTVFLLDRVVSGQPFTEKLDIAGSLAINQMELGDSPSRKQKKERLEKSRKNAKPITF
jgi:hypothetical protein